MKKHMPIIAVILLVIFVAGCGREQLPTQSAADANSITANGDNGSPGAFDIFSAELHFYAIVPNGQATNAHRVTALWDESSVSWNSFAESYDSYVVGSTNIGAAGWQTIDVTELAQAWASDTIDNFGILLEQPNQAGAPVALNSSESAGFSPFLEICYPYFGALVCDTVYPTGDAFIDQNLPGASTGSNMTLLLGRMMIPNAEKQTLFQFDLPDVFYQVVYSSIGGTAWKDADQDGILEGGEISFPGVRVRLYDCQSVLLDSAVTDLNGAYKFDSLTAGEYFVEFVAPPGYFFSPKDQSPSDILDSDVDTLTGRTDCFTLAEGEDQLNWSAGLCESPDVDPGCTHGLGYWKHIIAGTQVSNLSDYLPIWLGADVGSAAIHVATEFDAYQVITMRTYGDLSNGITKLYAHLLVTKLNIASGADPDEINTTVSAADAFLGLHSWSEWDQLTEDQRRNVLMWKDECESYNEGSIGPGSCDGPVVTGDRMVR